MYFRTWLALQCSLIPSARQGVLVMEDAGSYAPVAKWPEGGREVERLAEVCERALEARSGLLVELDTASDPLICYGIAYPVLVDRALHGVAAVEVGVDSEGHLKDAMGRLQWGVGWLELWFRRRRAEEDEKVLARLKAAVDLLASVLAEERFEGASLAFVTGLAAQTACDRVSLGFARRGQVTVRAVSHSAQFGERMNLNRSIALAMEEAIVQRSEVRYPAPPEAGALVTRDHEHLSRQQGAESILTIPLYGNGAYYGALTLERPAERPFLDDDVAFCRSAAGLAGLALEGKRRQDRALPLKVLDACRDQLGRFLGPGHTGRKLVAFLLVGAAVFFSVVRGDYRLSADATLEGTVRRALVAPFDGYIREAPVRAGDLVQDDAVMCLLDDRDLRLEQLNRMSQQSQLQRQLHEALAAHDRVQVNILNAQLDQVRAQLDLANTQLDRTQIRAPFAGVVVSGDLSQRLGGAVERGEVLFEVSPLNAYRVILEVDESRIADVRQGQRGGLVLSALPDRHFGFAVEKITPISSAQEGRNYFRVEAQLDSASERLRPGMEGIGKILVDRRRIVSIWSRDLLTWLRLRVWSWWP